LKNADIALNRAKEEGRDVVKEYSEDFDKRRAAKIPDAARSARRDGSQRPACFTSSRNSI
jgi:hypothetical protein